MKWIYGLHRERLFMNVQSVATRLKLDKIIVRIVGNH
nr:MAG TPA: hypothetical protein [Caudoviricetes sp.]